MVGQHGDREQCIDKFEASARADPSLMAQVSDLSGKVLVCHCGAHERCHGDVLISLWREMRGIAADEEDATSDEDFAGEVKAKVGDGWRGAGLPLMFGRWGLEERTAGRWWTLLPWAVAV